MEAGQITFILVASYLVLCLLPFTLVNFYQRMNKPETPVIEKEDVSHTIEDGVIYMHNTVNLLARKGVQMQLQDGQRIIDNKEKQYIKITSQK